MDENNTPTLIKRDDELKKEKQNKVPWNFRTDENLKQETEVIVQARKGTEDEVSMTEYVMNSIKQTNEGRDYESLVRQNQVKDHKIDELTKENTELRSLTTKKIPVIKRISLGFTRDEYEMVDDAAHSLKISRNEFLKQCIFPEKNKLVMNQPKALVSMISN